VSTIRVLYSCDGCGIDRASVEIAERAEGEHLGAWMDKLAVGIAIDHAARSPTCRSVVMREVMIPVQADDPVGAKPRN
jgi:hypothetical protein